MSPLLSDSAVTALLSLLLRQTKVKVPLTSVFLSTNTPATVERVLNVLSEKPPSTCRPAASLVQDRPLLSSSASGKGGRGHLLRDLPGFDCMASVPPTAMELVATSFSASASFCCDAPPLTSSAHAVYLPLSLMDVARLYRAKHREQRPSFAARAHTPVLVPLLESPGDERKRKQLFELFCSPASKEIVVVDVPDIESHETYIWESLLVAESMLQADGALLLVSPQALSRRVRRFLQWRFQHCRCAASDLGGGGCFYAICSTAVTDFSGAAVQRDDFPGFLSAGMRRPRKWNPYRRQEKKKFVASVLPCFTNAPKVHDALRRSAIREKEVEEQLREADDAFFGVAHEMVEKGLHYSHPEN